MMLGNERNREARREARRMQCLVWLFGAAFFAGVIAGALVVSIGS